MNQAQEYLKYICTEKKCARCGKKFGVLDTKNYAWKGKMGDNVKFSAPTRAGRQIGANVREGRRRNVLGTSGKPWDTR